MEEVLEKMKAWEGKKRRDICLPHENYLAPHATEKRTLVHKRPESSTIFGTKEEITDLFKDQTALSNAKSSKTEDGQVQAQLDDFRAAGPTRPMRLAYVLLLPAAAGRGVGDRVGGEHAAAWILISAVSRPIRLVLGPVEVSRSPLGARRGVVAGTCRIDAH